VRGSFPLKEIFTLLSWQNTLPFYSEVHVSLNLSYFRKNNGYVTQINIKPINGNISFAIAIAAVSLFCKLSALLTDIFTFI